ncbi:phosphate uptake regulator PhoU [Methanolobus profundi]|uniref:phosphate uptake regulator PhoU n=1 Tax=Methanolobus profundi TaxID=487685 RepID=UPI000B8460F5|nr:phosphate uptake regulator PhoU [Methanolobus profundi]
METRKVQQTGGSTYIISLPKTWADKVGIQTGSRVSLQPQPDGKLVIDPIHDAPPIRRIQIDVSGRMGDALTRDMIAAYLAGSDIIEVKADRIVAEQKNVIRGMCYKLIGPEIIEETAKKVVIQDLLNPDEISIKKSVRRMYLISNSMHMDAIKAIKTLDSDLALDVDQRDDDVDRLFLLIAKQFRSILRGARLPDAAETSIDEYHDLRMAAGPIERIADHARKIAKITGYLEGPIPDDIMEMIEKTSEISRKIVEDSIDALYNFDVDLANQVIDRVEKLSPMINKLNGVILKLDTYGSVVALGTVVDSIDRTADYGSNIAEIAINSAMTKDI